MLDVETLWREDGGGFPEPEGELIEVVGFVRPSEKLMVLTRYERGEGADVEPNDSSSEDEPYQCVGIKADGYRCGREVDEEGGTCFQHV